MLTSVDQTSAFRSQSFSTHRSRGDHFAITFELEELDDDEELEDLDDEDEEKVFVELVLVLVWVEDVLVFVVVTSPLVAWKLIDLVHFLFLQ